MTIDLRLGDCIEVIKTLPDASVDSVVTDPPYELGFMGKGWDASGIAYSVDLWREVLRVLKPGGHLLAFGGTRTYHRMAVAIEDAGFEVRDSIHWVYGSGFPKSLDVSKAIDKAAGVEREVIGASRTVNQKASDIFSGSKLHPEFGNHIPITAPATDAAKQWSGWGTALKPAHEPVVVARKPLVGTVAANVQTHGTGALNIDGCRVDTKGEKLSISKADPFHKADGSQLWNPTSSGTIDREQHILGRWPSNTLLAHDPECGEACAEDCPVAEMDRQSKISRGGAGTRCTNRDENGRCRGHQNAGRSTSSETFHGPDTMRTTDSGGASRFFPVFRYQAKASRSERGDFNKHPTVKPVALMRWLVRLVTPPSGVVLEPFMGSGTTGVACVNEAFSFIGIEREPEYFEISKARIGHAQAEQPAQKELFK